MAFEHKFFIDHENHRRVTSLTNRTVIQEWKSFHGSIQPMRICMVTPAASVVETPYFTVEDNAGMELSVALILVPDQSTSNQTLQGPFKLSPATTTWTRNTETKDWTGELDLNSADLKKIVQARNPGNFMLQFDVKRGTKWTTICQIRTLIYENLNLLT